MLFYVVQILRLVVCKNWHIGRRENQSLNGHSIISVEKQTTNFNDMFVRCSSLVNVYY